jgi:hypothetical protein
MYSTVTGFTPASYQGNNQSPPASLEDLFVSIVASSEDLHLEGGATAIDTGTPLSFTEDIDEDPRPMAFAWDIGADEAEDEGLAISSAADQTFTVGDPDTLISAITITNSSPAGVITAASDLRIRIPPSFNMTWDTTDTTAVLGGVAAAKVSTAVTYEDSDKTLVLDVTTTFAADDSVTIQGLNFINFTGLSGLANLTVDIYNDGASDATDGKTIEIVSAGPLSISSAANQIFQMGDPATAIATITITEDASIPVITAADDLRVQIPIGFNMTWDTSDTGAVLGGTGVSKVSPVVSYEDSGRTLRLDVTSDFAAGETVTVSALSFDGFTVASAPDNLELEVDGAGAPGRITLEETVTGGTSDTSPVMMPTIQGGTSQTYVLSIATRRNRDVTAVSGGGGLTWTERTEQCSGRNHQGMRVWTAQGSPGSPFQVQIDYNDSMPLSAVLGRYSGVASFEDPTSENTNGESGSCSGGSDNSSPQLTLTSTVANSIHVVALNHRNRGVRSFSAGRAADPPRGLPENVQPGGRGHVPGDLETEHRLGHRGDRPEPRHRRGRNRRRDRQQDDRGPGWSDLHLVSGESDVCRRGSRHRHQPHHDPGGRCLTRDHRHEGPPDPDPREPPDGVGQHGYDRGDQRHRRGQGLHDRELPRRGSDARGGRDE